jgi:hypothetical protein
MAARAIDFGQPQSEEELMNKQSTHINILRAIYTDLSCIAKYAAEDIVLHTADRGAFGGPAQVVGKQAVLAKELDLIRLTGNTLVMDVQNFTANDHFGAVLGILRARHKNGSAIGMPFCGLWRFHDGKVIEHWENAYDAMALGRFLMGDTKSVGSWLCT